MKFLALTAALLAPSFAMAQANCAQRDFVEDRLRNTFGESLQVRGAGQSDCGRYEGTCFREKQAKWLVGRQLGGGQCSQAKKSKTGTYQNLRPKR